jgi:hypothetical protein
MRRELFQERPTDLKFSKVVIDKVTSKAKKKEEQRHANKYESREGRRKLEENDGGMLHIKELDQHLIHQE